MGREFIFLFFFDKFLLFYSIEEKLNYGIMKMVDVLKIFEQILNIDLHK